MGACMQTAFHDIFQTCALFIFFSQEKLHSDKEYMEKKYERRSFENSVVEFRKNTFRCYYIIYIINYIL